MNDTSHYVRIAKICLFLTGTIVFASFAFQFSYLIYKQSESLHWPHTEATIEQWNVIHIWPRSAKTGLYRYELQPTLSYAVQGRRFSTTELCYGTHHILSDFGSRSDALAFISKLPERGNIVEAQYNPKNPSQAVLTSKNCSSGYDIFMLCMTIGFYGLFLFIVFALTGESLVYRK